MAEAEAWGAAVMEAVDIVEQVPQFSGQSWVPSWYRNTLAALFCTLLLLVAAAVVIAVYIEDRHIESSKVSGAAVASDIVEQLPHYPTTTR